MQKKFLRSPRSSSIVAIIGAIVGFAVISISIFILMYGVLWPTSKAVAASCAGSGITGVTFRDYNYNGQREAAEPGVAGVIVTAFSVDGSNTSCESKADGSYGIDPAGGYPVRLEFTLPAGINYLKAGVVGTDSKTSVTFVNGPSSNIHVGFSNPGQYCGSNPSPDMATSCMVFGNSDGVNKELPTLYSFPYTAGSTSLANAALVSAPAPTTQALAKQVGSVWGLAWNPREKVLYAAAFMKRHAGFGPSGVGAIYKVSGSMVSLFHDFGAIMGSDPHPALTDVCTAAGHNNRTDHFNCELHDRKPSSPTSVAFDQVSKIAFGDIDLSPDGSKLYAVNLANKTLMLIPIDNPAGFSSVAVPTPNNCPASDVRPFGLGLKDDKTYLGMVCSAESSKNSANLRAYVYTFDGNAFSGTPLLEFTLSGRRSSSFAWQYWVNQSSFTPSTSQQTQSKWAQPMLTDIEFTGEEMIVALRDRNGDQIGVVAGGPDPNDSKNYTAIARGDILRACSNGSGWTIENGGKCNGQGPGGSEYYSGDSHPTDDETALGSVAQVAGLPDVVTTVFNPVNNLNEVSDGGIKWLNNSSGVASRSYRIYDGSTEVARFDKASGMGDLEALCPLAAIEIGNRVWIDSNNDGVQGADEAGKDGVKVELYRNGTLVASTTTSNGGQYYFNSGIDPGTGTPGGDSEYEIRIPGFANQGALNGLQPTTPNTDANTNNADQRDSDGVVAGVDVIYHIPYADLAGAGYNNHTYDFGFVLPAATPTATATDTPTATPTGTLISTDTPTATPTETPTATASTTPAQPETPTATATASETATPPPPTATPTNTPTPSATSTTTATPTITNTPLPLLAAIGDYVWEDLDKDGIQDKGEPPVPGITVKLLNANGNVIKSTVTDVNGKYLFDKLPAGTYSLLFTLPTGYQITQPDSNANIQDLTDSDVNPVTLKTITTTLDAGETDLSWDMGIFRVGTDSPDDPEPAMTQKTFLPFMLK